MVITSKKRIRTYVLLTFLFIFSSAIALLGMVLLIDAIKIPTAEGLTFSLFFTSLGYFFLRLTFLTTRKVKIDLKWHMVTVKFMGLFSRYETSQSELKYSNYPFENQFGSYDGILIQDAKGNQIQFSEFETKNYQEVRDAISKILPYDANITINSFQPDLVYAITPMLISFLLFVIFKLSGF